MGMPPAGPPYGGGATIAQHQGNSVSEIDPTYALQNANLGPNFDFDPYNQRQRVVCRTEYDTDYLQHAG